MISPGVLGREVHLTVATIRLIGVFDRFPELKIVIAHFGGGIAAVKDRLVGKGYRFGTLKKPFADTMTWFISTWPGPEEVRWRSTVRCRHPARAIGLC